MSKVAEILKLNGIKKVDFARKCFLSRPTLDLYISKYEKGEKITNDYYDNLFHNLFDNNKSKEEINELISNIPAKKKIVIKYNAKLTNDIDYYNFKQMIATIRFELDNLEKSLDIIYKENKDE